MINIEILKKIAQNRIKMEVSTEDDLILFLQYWWSEKYKLPPNHPLFLDRTVEEHTIDFFMDKCLNDPNYGKAEKEKADHDKYEEELKRKMGDDYHEEYDYLTPPTTEQLRELGIEPKVQNNKQEEIINEEDFPDKIEEVF